MARKKVIVPVAHKRAIARIEQYKENVKSGKELQSEVVERFEADIRPFITKKGAVRKNLSQKNVKKFNSLVDEFKKQTASSFTRIEQKRKRTIKKAIQNETYTKAEAKTVVKTFMQEAVQHLQKQKGLYNFDSSQIVSLAVDYRTKNNITPEDINAVAKFIIDQKENDLPEEAKVTLQYDDTYNNMQYYLDNIEEFYKEHPDYKPESDDEE